MSCDCAEGSDLPSPLQGTIPFNRPGDPVVLRDSHVLARARDGSLFKVPAQVTLAWHRRTQLRWSVDDAAMSSDLWNNWYEAFRRSKSFLVEFGDHLTELDASLGSEQGGSLNGGGIGSPSAELEHVLVHWVGFPGLLSATQIHEHSNGGWRTWSGRNKVSLHGWSFTLDARSDLREVLALAKDRDTCVLTHVMDLRRNDGSTFTPDAAKRLLWGLQCAVSFARGHWAYPAAPVGFDKSGEAVWTEWGPGLAEPARNGLGWWDEHHPDDLWHAVDKFLAHWLDEDRHKPLQFATTHAVSAVETGFVEQRLLTAVTGLELLSWVIDVRERNVNEDRWAQKSAYRRLRKLLVEARVPIGIDEELTPALATIAKSLGYQDGPEAIIGIRHTLTHPKDNVHLYAVDKALAEAHLLSLRYLELVLLHRIGYRGHAYDRTHRGRWSGDSQLVPWAQPKRRTSPQQ